MKNLKIVPMAMACVAMGVTTITWPQRIAVAEEQPGAQQQQQQDQQSSEQRRVGRDAQTKFHLCRTKEILNKEVRNRQDEKVGKLEEIAVDVERGAAAYAILDVGGFLGIGGKHVAVPFEALNLEQQSAEARDARIVLDVDKDRIKNAPGSFDKDSWPDMTNTQWARDVHRYFGARPYWETARVARGGAERDLRGEPISPQQPSEQATPEGQTQRQRDRARADMPGKKMFKLEANLLNQDIKSQANNEDLGDVKDFLIDSNTGEIAFIIVEFDDTSKAIEDKNKRMAALPYQLVEFRKDKEGEKGTFLLTTNIDRVRGQLFSNEQWPKLTEREWAATVYRHYDLQPYWELRAIEQRGTPQQREGEQQQQQQRQNTPQQ